LDRKRFRRLARKTTESLSAPRPPTEAAVPKTDMRALDQNDVVRLLRSEVRRAGGQKEWARKSGVAPSMVSMVLTGDRPPNEKIISALKLRRVVIFERVR
jgi:hypothetical protein